jgi:hypothetical protein
MTQVPPENEPQQPTPYADSSTAMPRTSGAAITALILGILLCIPLVTGLGAILFGVVGIRATRNANVRGRGMAVAGLTLGIVGLLGWLGLGGMLGVGWLQTSPDRAIATAFVHDLDSGNLSAAQAKCSPSITPTQIQQAAAYLKTCGTLSAYSNNSYNMNWNSDGTGTAVISGTATYSSGTHAVSVTFLHPRQGGPVIQGYNIQ